MSRAIHLLPLRAIMAYSKMEFTFIFTAIRRHWISKTDENKLPITTLFAEILQNNN
jgi:hypothetical protein